MSFVWTEAATAMLRVLIARGESYNKAGNIIGCGKNAAIGKGHRLGLITVGTPAAITGNLWTETEIATLRQLVAQRATVVEALAALPDRTRDSIQQKCRTLGIRLVSVRPKARRVLKLRAPTMAAAFAVVPQMRPMRVPTTATGGCRFPMWGDCERPTHVHCGAPAAGSWCAKHYKRVFTVKQRRKAA